MTAMESFLSKLRTANWKNQFLFNIGFPARIVSLFGDVEILKGTGRAVPTPVGTKGELAATTAPTDQQVFMVDDWDGHGANRQFVYDAHSAVIADGTFIVEPTAPGVAGNYIALAWGVHTHIVTDVTGLQAALAAKAPKVAGTDGHVVVIDGTGSAQGFKDGGPMPSGGSGSGGAWLSGTAVPTSGLGVNGDHYLRTTNGDVYEKADSEWTVVANLKGPAGTNGLSILTGTAVPTSGLGVNGDHYLRTTNGDVYEKADSEWTVVANLKGPAGTNGLSILTTSGAPAGGTGADGQYAYDPTAMTMYGPKATTWPEGVLLKGADGAGGTTRYLPPVTAICHVLPEGPTTGQRFILDETAEAHANQIATYDAADGGSWAYEVAPDGSALYCAGDMREGGSITAGLVYFNGTAWAGVLNAAEAQGLYLAVTEATVVTIAALGTTGTATVAKGMKAHGFLPHLPDAVVCSVEIVDGETDATLTVTLLSASTAGGTVDVFSHPGA